MGIIGLFVCLTCVFINLLLVLIFYYRERRKDVLSHIYYCLSGETILLCFCEIMRYSAFIKGGDCSSFLIICTTLFFAIVTVLAFSWMLFILAYFSNDIKKFWLLYFILFILIIIEFFYLVVNLKKHNLFYYLPDNQFKGLDKRYLIIFPQVLIYAFIFIYSIIKTAIEKNVLIRKRHIGICYFSSIPLIYCIGQLIFTEVPFDVMGFTIGCVIIYAFNINKKSEKELFLQKKLLQETTTRCIQVLYEYNTTEVAIDKLLGFIAQYHNAEHTYIFEFNKTKNMMSITYEWCNKGINSQGSILRNINVSYIESWIQNFDETDFVIIDTDKLDRKKDENIQNYLTMNYIKNLIAVPLRDNGSIVGFLGVSNPNSYKDDSSLLHSVSSIVYSEILRRKLSERNNEIIQILASEYTSVYYANLEDGILIPYAMNKDAERKYGQIFGKGIELERAFRIYIDNEVYEADKETLRKTASINYIKKALASSKSTELVYRKDDFGSPVYAQVKFVKIDDVQHEPTAVAIGFSDKNEEVIGKFVTKQLLDSYASIYYIDLQKNTIRAYKESTTMDVGKFKKVLPYDKVVHIFAESVSDKYKEMWEKFTDPVYAQNFLADENAREIIYEVPELERPIRRAIWTVVERNAEGLPITVIASFMGIDKTTSEKMELDAKLAEQKKILESQAILLEDALSQAQIANEAKTMFLTNMSHDIRTPMNAIVGFTELALQNLDDKECVKNYLLKSNVSSQHLLSLINDILDMNRIESGKFVLNEDVNSISTIVEDIKAIIHGLAESKKQRLEIVKFDVKDDNIYCDKVRIHQIIINVISNAIKFTPEGGKIEISICQTESLPEKGRYEIKVKDNGVGMSEDFKSKIFIPFEREKTSTISKTQGTGLGMAITKSIVDMMKGAISVESTLGQGTEFTFDLTFKTTSEKPKNENEVFEINEQQFKGKRVLIVEDNEMNREIIEEILQESGFKTESAEDGKYAVEMVRKSNPGYYDLVLMDIQMPIMDGYTATKVIRKLVNKQLANIPIIAMTANAFEEDRQQALKIGMNEHVTKPISVEELFKAISKIL